jgi:signal transduction histidine kinase/CheY-like chemotaxis protein
MPNSFLICGGENTLTGVWDSSLVALSCLVAIGGSFAALECANRMRAADDATTRRRYFFAGASLMGVAIWTMHFVGMLAHNPGVPVNYEPMLSAVSMLAAACGAGVAFLIVNRPTVTPVTMAGGGTVMGLAIASMHYLGMASMRLPATIHYEPGLFVASVALAIAASTTALVLARRPIAPGVRGYWIKASAAVVLGAAIAGMHYTGMAAACYLPADATGAVLDGNVGTVSLKELLIAAGAIITGALLILMAKNSAERQLALESLEDQRHQAVEALRAKETFLAALSHELRTPLNPALLVATDGAANPEFSEAARRAFATIAQQISYEARLIDDLLDITRSSRGVLRIDRRPTDLHLILRRAIATVQSDLAAKRLELRSDLAATKHWAGGDESRLLQVFCNLLQNSIKFTPAGGLISVRSADLDDGRIEIAVTDNGRGLTPPELERCFARFAQGEHQLGGLGLGLAIAQAIVELHGGVIAATSPGRDRGATFRLELPGAYQDTPAREFEPTPSRAPFTQEGPRVLLVEDHDSSRQAIERVLHKRGYRVTAVATVAAGLETGRKDTFEILISDIGLPDGTGYGLLEQLGPNAPALKIAMTGYGMDDDIRRARDAGFNAHVTKPVTVDRLERVLTEAPTA